jgi:hypothetical protein
MAACLGVRAPVQTLLPLGIKDCDGRQNGPSSPRFFGSSIDRCRYHSLSAHRPDPSFQPDASFRSTPSSNLSGYPCPLCGTPFCTYRGSPFYCKRQGDARPVESASQACRGRRVCVCSQSHDFRSSPHAYRRNRPLRFSIAPYLDRHLWRREYNLLTVMRGAATRKTVWQRLSGVQTQRSHVDSQAATLGETKGDRLRLALDVNFVLIALHVRSGVPVARQEGLHSDLLCI